MNRTPIAAFALALLVAGPAAQAEPTRPRSTDDPQAGGTRRGATPATSAGSQSRGRAAVRKVVTVYGADWCSACKNARAYFGQRHDIEFIYLDINREQRAYNDALNRAHAQGVPAAGVPIIEVGSAMNSRDSRFFVGFYPDEMNHVLSDDAPAAKSPRASAEPPRSAPRK